MQNSQGEDRGKVMNKAIRIVIAAAALALAAVYAGGCVYYRTHLFPHTTVDGTEAGRLTPQEAVGNLKDGLLQRIFTVTSDGRDYTVTGEVLLLADQDAAAASVAERDWYFWPYEAFRDHPLTAEHAVRCDAEKLAGSLDSQGFFAVSAAPVNAVLSDFETGRGYTVIPDRDGYRIDRADALAFIASRIEAGEERIDISDRCRVQADITADNADLNRMCDSLNRLTGHELSLTFADYSWPLNGDLLNSWIVEGENGEPEIGSKYIASYSDSIQETCAEQFAERQKETGFKYIVDAGQLAEILTRKLKGEAAATESDAIEIPVLEADPAFDPQYGMDYVSVDLEAQTVRLFRNAKVTLQSPCVTGIPTKDRQTRPGVFKIRYKQRDRVLVGPNDSYHSFVSYWMPFDEGRGLHDASWRDAFGGKIYRHGGSHGCVNLPTAFAKELYAAVNKGETVVVY